ncbi:MAG: response regulator transcription factor [Chitinophagaceae bacterium]|nr:response regulator transcription factor [Chitinophagaceae bacterium]
MRCIIVDDEPLAREGMELLIKEAGFLELKASCSNAIEANRVLTEQEIDLIFLDIQMPRIRGIDFLRSLPVHPLVIITTAYPHYALEGFELNVLDYLLKPITIERFLKAVNRAREAVLPENYFFIKTGKGYEKILHQEILFIEASQNYSIIHTPRGKFITLTALRSIEEQLPPARFLRVHKSYVVSVDQIQGVAGNEITIDKHKIPFSKNYREPLMRMIDSRLIRK